ncbi:MAG: hypothetical protein ACFFKA_13565, partial [Candidatus Thorarchaeota archaeon]
TGSFYIITDFKTCYDQPDYDYNKNAEQDIGEVEINPISAVTPGFARNIFNIFSNNNSDK